jgi:transcriptional regulator with XRE-family HTH domain
MLQCVKIRNSKGGEMAELRFDAARLQDLMDKRAVSDYQLAKRTGISRTMIYYLRKGERKSASAEVMTKLANALETTLDYLIGAEGTHDGRVTVTVPEGVRRLTEIANRLSELRQEELVRIAAALEQVEREQAATLDSVEIVRQILAFSEIYREGDDPDLFELLEVLRRAALRRLDTGAVEEEPDSPQDSE